MAGHVSEGEILDCLRTHLRGAISDCLDLAVLPQRGPVYRRMRESLKLAEGCCRQLAYYRDNDARWLPIGLLLEEAHQRSLRWLRTIPRTTESNAAHPLFLLLADNLRKLLVVCAGLESRATGRVGMILPKPRPGPHRESRPVQVLAPGLRSPGGVWLP